MAGRTEKGIVTINNVPQTRRRYVVARLNMGELWYWTSWDSREEAERNISQNSFEEVGIVIDLEVEK